MGFKEVLATGTARLQACVRVMDKLLYAAVGGLVTYAIIRIYDNHKRKNNRVVPAPSTIWTLV